MTDPAKFWEIGHIPDPEMHRSFDFKTSMLIMNVKKKKALSYQAEFVENMLISR